MSLRDTGPMVVLGGSSSQAVLARPAGMAPTPMSCTYITRSTHVPTALRSSNSNVY